MRVWHFSEMPYTPAWAALDDTYRVTIPSRLYDPRQGADLYHRFLDEWALCDEVGLDIMVNEHHATVTCATAICTIPLAILARETKRARLLALGMPLANRAEPVRIAEEFAMLDVISRGRIEMGFVRGVPYEIAPSNSNPADMTERFWEAHDLILKALSARDGPFNWEGRHFHYRQVNVWPRPWQEPHPPVWITVGSPQSAAEAAARGYVIACLNTGYARTPVLFGAYRDRARENGRQPAADRFAYLAMIGVGTTAEEGYRRADQVLDYTRTSGIVARQFANPPGYAPVAAATQALRAGGGRAPGRIQTRDGRPLDPRTAGVEDFIAAGLAFAGTPDMVFDQIRAFHGHIGGFGHLLMMGQGGQLGHAETVANLRLFSSEVLPRLAELG
jgi:alkanesulfonate monooxygenase SsuD/methylene tetrahydromethanopterin reductase-like flavin-dependent oxidoreductase (luciferase family)